MRQDVRVDLGRIAWISTVGAAVIAAALLLASAYYGYAALALAIAASAAVNLRG